MKSALVLLSMVACTYAATSAQLDQGASQAEVLRSSYDNSPDGGFQYSYETSNGIASQVEGKVKQLGKDEVALEVSGSSQYQSPEGETIQISYVANENGYQPQGAHLPTPPPPEAIPEYILRSIEYIKAHPYVEKA